jgi:hypothetical protein
VLNELKQLDVDRVPTAAAGGPTAHATGIGAPSAEAILVTPGTLQRLGAAVMLARDWRKREPEGGVRIQIDGDALELPYATAQGKDRLIGMFLERHAAEAPE